LIDEILNAVLFVLIGLEVLALTLTGRYLLVGLGVIPVVLFARLASVVAPLAVIGRWGRFGPATRRVLTWGGLRGGISVALALSIPAHEHGGEHPVPERDVLVALTYVVVVFSILVQGLTVGPLTRRWLAANPHPPAAGPSLSERSPAG
jgi:CPA1 family monovalent cation:H+ antiporter